MESVGFEERAGGGSRSSTVAWPHVNSYRSNNLNDPRVKVNHLPHDIYVPMQKSCWPGTQDHLSGRWRPLPMKLLLSFALVVTYTCSDSEVRDCQ